MLNTFAGSHTCAIFCYSLCYFAADFWLCFFCPQVFCNCCICQNDLKQYWTTEDHLDRVRRVLESDNTSCLDTHDARNGLNFRSAFSHWVWSCASSQTRNVCQSVTTTVVITMGSHHRQRGDTGPGWKARPFCPSQIFPSVKQNNLAFYPGPVLPPRADGSPLQGSARSGSSNKIYLLDRRIHVPLSLYKLCL